MASEWPAIIFAKADAMGWWTWPGSWHGEEDHVANLYIHRDSARAWQAFRDFLNGVGEQGDMSLWKARCEQHFTDGQLQIALGHFPLRVRDEFEKRMTAEAIAQYERLQDHD